MECENSVGGEFRVAGPPGCGKTTWLSRQIENAAHKHGSDAVFVASFTKTAAVELVNRNLPIHDSAVGTLHSHCFRAIGDPQIAEAHIKDFNEAHPAFTLSSSGKPKLDEAAADTAIGDSDADILFSEYNILRNKMTPREKWNPKVTLFAEAWEHWKKENDLLDFTDLIQVAHDNFDAPLNNPSIGFIDECQDLTPLQFSLIRKWGQSMDYFILVGDPNQLLYSFTGATVEPFLSPIDGNKQIILKQSYRVPKKPHAIACKWIAKAHKRDKSEYLPTPVEGSFHKNIGTYNMPSPTIDAVEKDLDEGMTVMILANCAYQLQPTIAELRRRGIPYHNPYRVARGDWNPLARRKGWTSSDRLLAFLEPAGPEYYGEAFGPIQRYWTPAQLNAWVELCSSRGLLEKGAKERLKKRVGDSNTMTNVEMADLVLETLLMDAIPEALALDPYWLKQRLSSTFSKRLDFPVTILERRGKDALREAPRVIVGTVHSVKGGSAESVYVFPDVSLASWNASQESEEGYDSLIRQGYVAFTRCSQKLTLCDHATACHMGRL